MGNCITNNTKTENVPKEDIPPKTILTKNSSLATIYSVSKEEREEFYKTLTTPDLYELGKNDANARRWADNRETKQFIKNQNRRAYG